MNTIDPTTHHQHGTDTSGKPVRLGEIDSDGYFVGWISPDGDAYESRQEQERANGAGHYDDYARFFRKHGLPLPDPRAFVRRRVAAEAVSPENEDAVVREIFAAEKLRMMVKLAYGQLDGSG